MLVVPPHLPTAELIRSWPTFTTAAPLRILASGCVTGAPCGADGTSYGEHSLAQALFALPNVRVVPFCPEQAAFGTPRAIPDIHGGNGFDVLEGRARVLSERGEDWTNGMIRAGSEMQAIAVREAVRLALLMDVSAACGSTVLYRGARRSRLYQRGPGVAAAMLMRAGIPIVSQRDERTLSLLFDKLGASAAEWTTDGRDHHERQWYREYFGRD